MSLNCHCYSCNVGYPANVYISPNNKDKQNLILLVCKRIFKAVQNNHTSTEISYDENTMLHKQIRNINEVNNCINEEFSKLFRNNVLRKETKRLSICIWRIEFKWTEFDNDSLIKGLLEISKEWYESFTKHLQEIDDRKRNAWLSDRDMNENEGELKQCLLQNLKKYLPGFEYLFEYSWKSYDDNYCRHKGDFIFASDYGIFVVVEVKWLNERNGYNARWQKNVSRNDVRTQASKYKNIALEKFNGKCITVLGATFTNNLDDNSLEEATLEFIDNDEIIMQYLKEEVRLEEVIFSRRYNELVPYRQTSESYNRQGSNSLQQARGSISFQQAQRDLSSDVAVGVAAVAAVAGVAAAGYLAYQAVKTPKRRAMLGLGITLFQAIHEEFSKDDDDNDRFRI